MVFGKPKFNDKYIPRKLEDRSNLTFEFPQRNGRTIQAFLPMLENMQVTESKSSNLATYDILGKSSNLFSYLGAKSRRFTLRFNITFLNVLEVIGREGLQDKFRQHFNLFWEDTETQKKAFKAIVSDESIGSEEVGPVEYSTFNHAQLHRKFYHNIAKLKEKQSNFFDSIANFTITDLLGGDSPILDQSGDFKELNRTIDMVVFWINLVRASVMNNSTDTTLGPPTVRLTHGILYNNVPCVTDSYNIRIVEEAGYDVQTLLPRQLEVIMQVNESRVGDFGEFQSSKFIKGDNHTGWESIISDGNADPYNGGIGEA